MTSSKLALASALAASIVALGGCPGDEPENANPSRLWLALDGSEIQVKLSPVQPPIF